ncbi:hypothetical protein CSHISOI_00084 [Colletotrichum shisoi]|uniref:Uncharacterized protein n=1 Tax=Colletotrichum shisoi TaxID=2078593 RepID=A0A5Q4C7I4_9PEZI|nr:hypothetical protein CSHISOI_00084 [Colletotrichum shisoi]
MPGQGHKRWRTAAHLNSRHPADKPRTTLHQTAQCPLNRLDVTDASFRRPSPPACVVSSGTAPLRRLKMAPVAARVACEAGLNRTTGSHRAVWVIEIWMRLKTDAVVRSWFSVILNYLSSSPLPTRFLTLFLTDAYRAWFQAFTTLRDQGLAIGERPMFRGQGTAGARRCTIVPSERTSQLCLIPVPCLGEGGCVPVVNTKKPNCNAFPHKPTSPKSLPTPFSTRTGPSLLSPSVGFETQILLSWHRHDSRFRPRAFRF